MIFRFPLAHVVDDGSPLPAYMLPSTKAEGRFRLVSGMGLVAGTLGMIDLPAQEAAASILREGRRAGPSGRKTSAASRQINLAREEGGKVKFYPEPGEATLDTWRLRWEPVDNTVPAGILTAAGWTRVADSLPLVERHVLHLVDAEASRNILWEQSRINLAALRAFLEFAPEIIPGLSRSPLTLLRLMEARGQGAPLEGEAAFYDQSKLRDLRRALDDPKNNAPWHTTPEGLLAISTGLRFSEPGEPETAFVAYYEGPEMTPAVEPIPLAGLSGKDADIQRKAFRHRKSINDLHRKIGANTFDFRNAPPDSAEAYQNAQYLAGLQDEIERHAAELAVCYRELVQVAARKREEILTRARRFKDMQATLQRKEARVESLREVFKPLSHTVTTHLAPHMTRLPVDLSLTRLTQGTGFQVTRNVANMATRLEKEMQIDMVLTDPEPNGLADLQKAARFLFGTDGPAHVPLLLYVALSSDLGTKTDIKGVRSFTVSEAWQRIRPGAVAEIRKDGVESWFKKTHKALAAKGMKAADVVKLSLRFLSSIRVPYTVIGPDRKEMPKVITGLLYQTSETLVDKKGRVTFNYTWNPELGELVGGTEGRRPSYMYSNHEALFSYAGRDLHTAPALQLILENMARAAAMGGGERMETVAGRLVVGRTPKGDDMPLGALVERLGLFGERSDNLHRRLMGALNAVEETGIVKVTFGANRHNKWEQKLRLEMSADYRDLYLLEKERQAAAEMKASLEKPFAGKPRGRPKGKKT